MYAQYNGKNARVVLDDVPSTSMPYDVNCSTIEDRSFYLFNTFCLILPLGLFLLVLLILQTCRPKIRQLLGQPSPGSSLNQNYAALILTGIVFSSYVLICDVFALGYTVKLGSFDYTKDSIKDLSIFTIAAIFAMDFLALLFSMVSLCFVSCPTRKRRKDCIMHYKGFFDFICFWRQFHHQNIEDVQCIMLTGPVNDGNTVVHPNTAAQTTVAPEPMTAVAQVRLREKHQLENKLWLLMASFTAPIVCIGTHTSFMIMAWSSDSDTASSMTVVFILSFLYYFLGFRQLYIMIASCPCTQLSREDVKISAELRSIDPYPDEEWFIISNPEITFDPNYSICGSLPTEEATTELKKYHEILSYFNFTVLLYELLTVPFLMGIEALVMLVYYFLPAPVTKVPSDVLNIFQLTLILGSGLIVYKLFKLQTPTEKVNFLDSYDPQNKTSSEDFAERVGKVLVNVLKNIDKTSSSSVEATA